MGARTRYPAPECPKCGKSGCSYVAHTYYTEDNEILRTRKCTCGWKWWTRQHVEESLPPEKWQIKIPKFKTSRILCLEQLKDA